MLELNKKLVPTQYGWLDDDDDDDDVNNNRVNAMLVIEIIPRDQNNPYVQIPKNGNTIEAYGAWVTDNLAGGWNELHPVWKLKILSA